MIIIQPSGGLCNRMRVINSGWKLARERHDQLKVLWNCNAELNCGRSAETVSPEDGPSLSDQR